MAYVVLGKDEEEVVNAVLVETHDMFFSGDQTEQLRRDLMSTRYVLARLVDAIAEQGLLTNDALAKIIRGY